jgi:hypothetical protein
MTPPHLDPAILAEVRAANLPRLMATAQAVQHAIQRSPLALEVKPTQKEPRT